MKRILTVALAILTIISYSSIGFPVTAATPSLSVSIQVLETPLVAHYNSVVVEANITSSGVPVSGAVVSFTDVGTFGNNVFSPPSAVSDQNGVTLTLYQSTGNHGTDTINATATKSGFLSGSSTTPITVLPDSGTQLLIKESAQIATVSGGSGEVVSGTVYICCYATESGATVSFTDTVGSKFGSPTVQTDSNGNYAVSLTLPHTAGLDFITATASKSGFGQSSSTVYVAVTPYNSADLTVGINQISPSTTVDLNSLVIEAAVTAGGTPVSGVSVSFVDGFGEFSFSPLTASTNASGVAVTQAQFNKNNGNNGADIITATASQSGLATGSAANIVTLLPIAPSQLSITENVQVSGAPGGSTDVVQGYVYSNAGNPVANAGVVVTDSIGSTFSSGNVHTDGSGHYYAVFTTARVSTTTFDLVTVAASDSGFGGSSSTVFTTVIAYSSGDLTVGISQLFPSTTTVALNFMVLEATVTAGGTPVSGAAVSFVDSFGELTFSPSTALTNSSGVAVIQVQFNNNNGNIGTDILTGTASQSGFVSGSASDTISILSYTPTQLSITENVQIGGAPGGSTDLIQGHVYSSGNPGSPVTDASVTLTDTIGSTFSSATVHTDSSGHYFTTFTTARVATTTMDLVTVAASASGFGGSSSTVFINVAPYGPGQLSIQLSVLPSTTSAEDDYLIVQASVNAAGAPISGVLVSFSDGCSSNFLPPTASTNAKGVATTTVQFTTTCGGLNVISATSTLTGYLSGAGATYMILAGVSGGQLSVQPAVNKDLVSSGSFDEITGTVFTTYLNCGFFGCGGPPQPSYIVNATVTFSDTIGSTFLNGIVQTDRNGAFSVDFFVGTASPGTVDFVTVSTSKSGLTGSSSTILLRLASNSTGVDFVESGLPSGTSWSITLKGVAHASSTSSIPFYLANGTYTYSVGPVANYQATTPSGNVTVAGNGLIIPIIFVSQMSVQEYPVTFTETGLTSGLVWSVSLNGLTAQSISSTISFMVLNGNFTFAVTPPSSYTASPVSGMGKVNGAAVPISIFFTSTVQTSYPVTITESGLQSGTQWRVTLNGVVKSSNTNTIVYSLSNGPFSWIVAQVGGYQASQSSMSDTVNNGPLSESVVFTVIQPAKYAATFQETGLASGSSWSMTLNGQTMSSTTTSISFTETNGVYSFSVGSVNGYTSSPSSSTTTINGADVVTSILFVPNPNVNTYPVTITESGLPPGTTWSVTLNGVEKSSTTTSIVYDLPNGPFTWTVTQASGYRIAPSTGSTTVNGTPLTESVSFTSIPTPTYSVAFQETGLPSGTTWSITFDGQSTTSTTTSISFNEPNGTYTFSIGSIDGYAQAPMSSTATVNGANLQVGVIFSQTPAQTSQQPTVFGQAPAVGYSIILTIVIVAAIGGVVVGRRMGKKSEKLTQKK